MNRSRHIPAIREPLAREDYQLADQLNRKTQGKDRVVTLKAGETVPIDW